jgi:hypothetical protein
MTTSTTIPYPPAARIHTQPSPVSSISSNLRSRRQSYPLSCLLLLSTLLISLITWHSYASLANPGTDDVSSGLATWGCGMSWMSPGYVKLDGPSDVNGLERKYSVWWYREGGIDSPVVSIAFSLVILLAATCTRNIEPIHITPSVTSVIQKLSRSFSSQEMQETSSKCVR